LNVYGHSKANAEATVLRIAPDTLVIRTSAFFGPWDQSNLLTQAMRALHADETHLVPNDLVITPTYVPDLAHATLDLLLDNESGIWHMSHGTALTWVELIQQAAERLGIRSDALMACPATQMPSATPRPRQSALASERGWIMPSLEHALDRYAAMMADEFSGKDVASVV
jgi:dTDP-4-dehydrorhamnose reductase